jgi:hypothetical protein
MAGAGVVAAPVAAATPAATAPAALPSSNYSNNSASPPLPHSPAHFIIIIIIFLLGEYER